MKDALHIVSDARIAWGLFITPNFPVRAADAGVRVLCRWYIRDGVRRAHFEKHVNLAERDANKCTNEVLQKIGY
jgi:uncharacterized protein YodC (DUF2158 family)